PLPSFPTLRSSDLDLDQREILPDHFGEIVESIIPRLFHQLLMELLIVLLGILAGHDRLMVPAVDLFKTGPVNLQIIFYDETDSPEFDDLPDFRQFPELRTMNCMMMFQYVLYRVETRMTDIYTAALAHL